MAKIHGKDGFVSLNGVDLSPFADNIDFNRKPDSHDLTCFGADSHVKGGGLLDGSATLSGKYDDGAAGPQATIDPLSGTVVPLIYRPEGTGTGKPQKAVNVLVGEYSESVPVADYIKWSLSLEFSGDVVVTTQA